MADTRPLVCDAPLLLRGEHGRRGNRVVIDLRANAGRDGELLVHRGHLLHAAVASGRSLLRTRGVGRAGLRGGGSVGGGLPAAFPRDPCHELSEVARSLYTKTRKKSNNLANISPL